MYLLALNCLKMVKTVNFVLRIFSHNLKFKKANLNVYLECNEIGIINLVSIQVLNAEDINMKKADKILKKLTV